MSLDPRAAHGPPDDHPDAEPPEAHPDDHPPGAHPDADPDDHPDADPPDDHERSDVAASPAPPSPQGDEPDVRFTYANERTFLAWIRTALALIVTGVAATQFLPKLDIAWGRRLLGLPLIVLGAIVAVESLRNWHANERAMRRGEPLPRSTMPLVLTGGIIVVGLIAIVIAALGTR